MIKKKRNKKILIIGLKEKFSLDKIYFNAFKQIGLESDIFVIDKIINLKIYNFFQKFFPFVIYFFKRKKIINFFENSKKNYDLIVVFKGIYLNKKTLIQCKKLSGHSKWINIFPDDPFNFSTNIISNKNVINCIDLFDFYCVWSKRIIINLRKIIIKKKIIYLPFGYDNFLHKKNNRATKKKYHLNFVGSHDRPRSDVIKYLHDSKKITGKNIVIAGASWIKKSNLKNFSIRNRLHGKNLSLIINNSKISLNILRYQNRFSHNMRTFEIPAMNGLMLTTRSKEQNEFFPENKACYMYKDQKELIKKIEYILKHNKEAEKVRAAGYLLSKKHSYLDRANYLLSRVF